MGRWITMTCAIMLVTLASSGALGFELQDLPPEEQAQAATMDNWMLGFYDQLLRFESASQTFKTELGDEAPELFMVGIESSLRKVALNKYWFKGDYGNKVLLSAARNEYESFQVALLPYIGKQVRDVTLTPGQLKQVNGPGVIEAAQMTIYVVGRVCSLGSIHADAMSDQLWPDPLLPNSSQAAQKMDLALFWVQIKVPQDAEPGDYRGQLQLTGDGQSLPIHVQLHVHRFALPDRVPFPVAAWTITTPENREQVYGEFLRHGIDPLEPSLWTEGSDDFAAFDKATSFCLAHGAQVFQIGSDLDKLKPMYDHVVAKGWLDKAITYTNVDEPSAEQFTTYNTPFHQQAEQLYPGLRVFLATQWHEGIDQGCDIWLNDLSTGRGMAFAAEHHGKAELWNYYCGIPVRCDFFTSRDDQPLMLLDRLGIEQRLPFWIAWKYGVSGILVYAGNRAAPQALSADGRLWQDQQSGDYIYSGNRNGDGYLMYPPCIPSIRMKIIRDGLEDYGYLLALKQVLPRLPQGELRQRAQAILAVPDQVMMDPHYFNRNPDGILSVRRQIADIMDSAWDAP